MFTDYRKYSALNTHDILKFLAITAMVIDHTGSYFFHGNDWFRLFGRIAFPLFLFLVGYSRQYRFRGDVLIYALLITLTDVVFHHPVFQLNILYTILAVRFLLDELESRKIKIENYLWQIFLVIAVWWFPVGFIFDYGAIAIAFAVCGYLAKRNVKTISAKVFLLSTLVFHIATQSLGFGFNAWQITTLTIITACIGLLLYSYKQKKIKLGLNGFLNTGVLFIARNSLQLYFIHLVILKIAASLLFPEQYENFRWIKLGSPEF